MFTACLEYWHSCSPYAVCLGWWKEVQRCRLCFHRMQRSKNKEMCSSSKHYSPHQCFCTVIPTGEGWVVQEIRTERRAWPYKTGVNVGLNVLLYAKQITDHASRLHWKMKTKSGRVQSTLTLPSWWEHSTQPTCMFPFWAPGIICTHSKSLAKITTSQPEP